MSARGEELALVAALVPVGVVLALEGRVMVRAGPGRARAGAVPVAAGAAPGLGVEEGRAKHRFHRNANRNYWR